MNILLVSPQFPDTFWSFKHALKFIHRKASFPPLGLLTVAALLPPDWNKRLVDLDVRDLRDADLQWADLAFVSAMVVQRDSARAAIARCKAAGVPVVAGGPLFMTEHDEFPAVDHFVLGEAEVALPPLLSALGQGKPGRVYVASDFADLRESPIPLFELADFKRYASMSVQFCRGCPYDCDFCNVTAMFGRRPRVKTAAQIIAELDRLCARGWRGPVFFVDDNLIGNKRDLKLELLPHLITWQQQNRRIPFTCQVSINLADDADLMNMMVHAGFDTVFIGIETPDTDALAGCNKNQNLNRDLLQDVRRIQRAGLEVHGGFIVGFDNDTPAVFQRQIDFIQRSGIATAMVGLLQAPAGTRLYERMKREGRLLGAMTGDNVDGTTNIVPRMSVESLREGYRLLLRHIYAPESYYHRVRTFLRESRPPVITRRVDLQRVLALLRSIGRLGIIGKERMHYWKLLAWALLRRPRCFSRAVTLAIYGYHFRRVTESRVE